MPSQVPAAECGVSLAPPAGGTPTFETVSAETPHRAVAVAEMIHGTHCAYAVTSRWDVVGRCGRCRRVVLAHERPDRVRGELRCGEC